MEPALIQSLPIWAAIGLAAGWLASLLLGGGGLVRYLLAGLIGSVVGSWVFSLAGITIPIDIWWVREIGIAFVGALIVIVLARFLAR